MKRLLLVLIFMALSLVACGNDNYVDGTVTDAAPSVERIDGKEPPLDIRRWIEPDGRVCTFVIYYDSAGLDCD